MMKGVHWFSSRALLKHHLIENFDVFIESCYIGLYDEMRSLLHCVTSWPVSIVEQPDPS